MSALLITSIVCGIAAVLSLIYSKYTTSKLIKHMKNQTEKALILKEMLNIELEYIKLKSDACTGEELEHLKRVDNYLHNNTCMLDKLGCEIDLSKIIIQESSIKDKEFQRFLKELQKCTDPIKTLVKRKQEITVRVVKLKRPRYYALRCMRNKLFFHIVINSIQFLIIVLTHIADIIRVTNHITKTINMMVTRTESWKYSEKIIDRSDSILST